MQHVIELVRLVGRGQDRADRGQLTVPGVQLRRALTHLELQLLAPATHRLERVSQLRAHRLETPGEHADLPTLRDADRLVEIPGRHLLGRFREAAYGSNEQAGAEEGEQPERCESSSTGEKQRLSELPGRCVRLAVGAAERDAPGCGRQAHERHHVLRVRHRAAHPAPTSRRRSRSPAPQTSASFGRRPGALPGRGSLRSRSRRARSRRAPRAPHARCVRAAVRRRAVGSRPRWRDRASRRGCPSHRRRRGRGR